MKGRNQNDDGGSESESRSDEGGDVDDGTTNPNEEASPEREDIPRDDKGDEAVGKGARKAKDPESVPKYDSYFMEADATEGKTPVQEPRYHCYYAEDKAQAKPSLEEPSYHSYYEEATTEENAHVTQPLRTRNLAQAILQNDKSNNAIPSQNTPTEAGRVSNSTADTARQLAIGGQVDQAPAQPFQRRESRAGAFAVNNFAHNGNNTEEYNSFPSDPEAGATINTNIVQQDEMMVQAQLVGEEDVVEARPALEGFQAIISNTRFKFLMAVILLVFLAVLVAVVLLVNSPSGGNEDADNESDHALPVNSSCGTNLQMDYRGPINVTLTGTPCQHWDKQHPYRHKYITKNYPLAGLESNYCRNPGGSMERAWCISSDLDEGMQYCAVPNCDGSKIDFSSICTMNPFQLEYTGKLEITRSGRRCQRWDSNAPHSHAYNPSVLANITNSSEPLLVLENNYCRNPSQNPNGAWCYTEDPKIDWEFCSVPVCPHWNLTSVIEEEGLPGQPLPYGNLSSYPYMYGPDETSGVETWEDAVSFCVGKGGILGSEFDYCGLDKRPRFNLCFGKDQHQTNFPATYMDQWSPIGDYPNAWVHISEHAHPLCITHRDSGHGDPVWGLEPGKWPWEANYVLCMLAAPQDTLLSGTTTTTGNSTEEQLRCGSKETGQSDYRGTINTTEEGIPCQRWDTKERHWQETFDLNANHGLEENYCRNPDGGPRAWCYTADPTIWWSFCNVPFCDNQTCGSVVLAHVPKQNCGTESNGQADYRGSINVTKGGILCQPWDSQEPHQHDRTPSNYPLAGLTGNACRNPDAAPRAWCYTMDPAVRWSLCDVPSCEDLEEGDTLIANETILLPQEEDQDTNIDLAMNLKQNCGSVSNGQADYRGSINVSEAGIPCQRWDSQQPHQHDRTPSNYEAAGLAGNACRNPDGEPRAWCYTLDPAVRWSFCNVPNCQEPADCSSLLQKQVDYRGEQSTTANGTECQAWARQEPHVHVTTPTAFPDDDLRSNYCRNPGGLFDRAWCYTMKKDVLWEYCDVPDCT